jgi:hypothetical protein
MWAHLARRRDRAHVKRQNAAWLCGRLGDGAEPAGAEGGRDAAWPRRCGHLLRQLRRHISRRGLLVHEGLLVVQVLLLREAHLHLLHVLLLLLQPRLVRVELLLEPRLTRRRSSELRAKRGILGRGTGAGVLPGVVEGVEVVGAAGGGAHGEAGVGGGGGGRGRVSRAGAQRGCRAAEKRAGADAGAWGRVQTCSRAASYSALMRRSSTANEVSG